MCLLKRCQKISCCFQQGYINKRGLFYKSRRFWEVSALGWCQEIRVLAEIPLYLRSTVSDCTSICSGRLECTHTPSLSEIISVWMHFIICVGEPPCLCLSAGLPVYPSVCVYVCLILDFCFFSFFCPVFQPPCLPTLHLSQYVSVWRLRCP